MEEKKLTITSPTGLHARSARIIVDELQDFNSDIKLINNDVEADAGSILELMMLAAAPGDTLQARVDGEDEEAAMEALAKLFEKEFGENEQDE
ncbi:MAG: HPr family phosphocarrier protein [bacterium]